MAGLVDRNFGIARFKTIQRKEVKERRESSQPRQFLPMKLVKASVSTVAPKRPAWNILLASLLEHAPESVCVTKQATTIGLGVAS